MRKFIDIIVQIVTDWIILTVVWRYTKAQFTPNNNIQILDSKNSSVMINKIIDSYEDEEFLKAEGFDEAIIGVDESEMRLIYSVSKCLDVLMKDMDEEEALEYFSFNVSGAYVGDKTPIWCYDNF